MITSSIDQTFAPKTNPHYNNPIVFNPKFIKNPFFKPQFPTILPLKAIYSKPILSLTPCCSMAANIATDTSLYTPNPPNRPLRTPHSGYHFDGSPRQFFEGWYFKVSIPAKKQSFCFMYSVENPAFRKKLTPTEEAKYGRRFTGVGAQILGPNDEYICQYVDDSQNFWGSRHELVLGNTFKTNGSSQPPNKEVPPEEFNKSVSEGFQVTPLWNQGFICDDGRTDYAKTVKTARWEYSTRPVYGWGNVSSKQKATAGWLAAFPIFEPHWQICMAGGLSTGWIEWGDERFEFENAPSYSEKNWGGAFPRKWFWAQCNVFEGAQGEVALTAAGGLRELPGGVIEDAALIGVHFGGVFYEFVPWNGQVEWDIAPWGSWKMSADNGSYLVELEATTEDPGCTLLAPTKETGLAPACKDTISVILNCQYGNGNLMGARERGYKRFFRRTILETSDFLNDDCLQLRCTVGVVKRRMETPKQYRVTLPPFDMGKHFKKIPESGIGYDIVFNVGDENFKAHKFVLAVRSPFFRAQFFGLIGNPNMDTVTLEDVEPSIFKIMSLYIYSDSLPDLFEIIASNSSSSMAFVVQHLLAAADRFGLERLKCRCESKLCDEITVENVATTLSLAEQHRCEQLKSACLKFAATNLNGYDI